MAVQILLRRGLAADWTSANPTLGAGELGFETDTKKFKIGDGTTAWNSITAYVAGPESLRLQDLLDVSGTAPSIGEVLKWNGTAWAPAADVTGSSPVTYSVSADTITGGALVTLTGSDLSSDSVKLASGTNVTVTRTDANTITISSTGGGGGGSLGSRTDVTGSTGSLANGASGPINITGFKSYALLKMTVDAAAWVRIYTSEAARQADNSRLEGTDPAPGSGVIAEVITTGSQTILISPGTVGFNDEATPTTDIPIRVTNKTGTTATINVTLTIVQLEA